MCCASGNRTGTSTACSMGQALTSTCMSSRRAVRRSTACCSSATGCAATPPIAGSTSAPSGSLHARTGSTRRTTPMPRPRWSRRFSRERAEMLEKRRQALAYRVGGLREALAVALEILLWHTENALHGFWRVAGDDRFGDGVGAANFTEHAGADARGAFLGLRVKFD